MHPYSELCFHSSLKNLQYLIQLNSPLIPIQYSGVCAHSGWIIIWSFTFQRVYNVYDSYHMVTVVNNTCTGNLASPCGLLNPQSIWRGTYRTVESPPNICMNDFIMLRVTYNLKAIKAVSNLLKIQTHCKNVYHLGACCT